MIEIPIIDAPDQEVAVVLDGRRVTFRFRYNQSSDRWSFDLSRDDQPVLTGRRIILDCDLLAGLHLNLGVLFAAGEGEPGRDAFPLGAVRLYHASASDVAALPS
jgi:hypothetical protein